MSDLLIASLCFTAVFPVPMLASLILLLPVAAIIQVLLLAMFVSIFVFVFDVLAARMAPNVLSWAQAAFMTLPDVLKSAQT